MGSRKNKNKKNKIREKNQPNRRRSTRKEKTEIYRNKKIEEKIEVLKEVPLTASEITRLLKNQKNFLGVYGSDELHFLKILQFPCFLVVNLDKISDIGRHWLCLRIGSRSVEIFDSLGGSVKMWKFYPPYLMRFIRNYALTHSILCTPVLQPPNSVKCGLYCIYFVIFRQFCSFSYLVRNFSSNLHEIIFGLLTKLVTSSKSLSLISIERFFLLEIFNNSFSIKFFL